MKQALSRPRQATRAIPRQRLIVYPDAEEGLDEVLGGARQARLEALGRVAVHHGRPSTPADFLAFSDRVRKITGGIPIGMKLSANHIEQDIGFAVDAGKTSKRLKWLGNAAYTLGTLWQVLKLKSYPLRIELDGQLLEQDNVFVEVSNTRYTGTSFMIAPSAEIDDGLLDVTLLRRLSCP